MPNKVLWGKPTGRKKMVRVIVDERERSHIPTHLKKLGLTVDFKMLDEGDYLVPGYAIERKSIQDFISSLYSGRLFNQAYRMRQVHRFSILAVEGDFFSALGKIKNPRVFWGALVSLSFEYDLRVFFTRSSEDTAELIGILAKHPPELRSHPPIIVRKPKSSRLRETQIALIEGLPGVGARLAVQLLKRLGTPRSIFLATEAELSARGGLGRAKAAKIASLLEAQYEEPDKKAAQLKLSEVRPQP
ncbi:MAG: endonuclease [Candidatus Bathyarchaeota archaeon]|nr:endonuclease [Candidatus Bathyarchaeota archaeon]